MTTAANTVDSPTTSPSTSTETQTTPVVSNTPSTETKNTSTGSATPENTPSGDAPVNSSNGGTNEVTPTPRVNENKVKLDAINDAINKNPNYRLKPDEVKFLSDVNDGLVDLESLPPEEGEVVESANPEVEEFELDDDFIETMEDLGVKDIKEIPNAVRKTFDGLQGQLRETRTELQNLQVKITEKNQIHENMATLLAGVLRGDEQAAITAKAALAKSGIDVDGPAVYASEEANNLDALFDEDNFFNPEAGKLLKQAFDAQKAEISKMKEDMAKFFKTTKEVETEKEMKNVESQEQARVISDYTDLVLTVPSFGLNPGEIKPLIEEFYATGKIPAKLAPLTEITLHAAKLEKERGYKMPIMDVYKLMQFEKIPEIIQNKVKEARKTIVAKRPSKNTLSGVAEKPVVTVDQRIQSILEKSKVNPRYRLTKEEVEILANHG